MAKFSNEFISLYDGFPRESNSRNNMIFLPVWAWEIIVPVGRDNSLNFFDTTVLEFIKVGIDDVNKIAEYMGVDVELILHIIEAKLVANGYLETNGKRIGKKLLAIPQDNYNNQKSYFLLQDAITGKFWDRIIPYNIDGLDAIEEQSGVKIYESRESGRYLSPYILDKSCVAPQVPNMNQIQRVLRSYQSMLASQSLRDHNQDDYLTYASSQNQKVDFRDYELLGKSPQPLFILTHLKESVTGKYICQLQDPCHMSNADDWIHTLHIDLSKEHPGFLKKIRSFSGQLDNDMTIDEYEKQKSQQIQFDLLVDFPSADHIENLIEYLHAIKNRLIDLKPQDIDDLLSQCQKAFEACFKKILKDYPHKHLSIFYPKLTKETLHQTLDLLLSDVLNKNILNACTQVNPKQVYQVSVFSTGKYPNTTASLRPMIISSILTIENYKEHTLLKIGDIDENLKKLFELCDYRNESSHDSGKRIDKIKAEELAEFTLQWIVKFLNVKG